MLKPEEPSSADADAADAVEAAGAADAGAVAADAGAEPAATTAEAEPSPAVAADAGAAAGAADAAAAEEEKKRKEEERAREEEERIKKWEEYNKKDSFKNKSDLVRSYTDPSLKFDKTEEFKDGKKVKTYTKAIDGGKIAKVQLTVSKIPGSKLRKVDIRVEQGPATVKLQAQDENGKKLKNHSFEIEYDETGRATNMSIDPELVKTDGEKLYIEDNATKSKIYLPVDKYQYEVIKREVELAKPQIEKPKGKAPKEEEIDTALKNFEEKQKQTEQDFQKAKYERLLKEYLESIPLDPKQASATETVSQTVARNADTLLQEEKERQTQEKQEIEKQKKLQSLDQIPLSFEEKEKIRDKILARYQKIRDDQHVPVKNPQERKVAGKNARHLSELIETEEKKQEEVKKQQKQAVNKDQLKQKYKEQLKAHIEEGQNKPEEQGLEDKEKKEIRTELFQEYVRDGLAEMLVKGDKSKSQKRIEKLEQFEPAAATTAAPAPAVAAPSAAPAPAAAATTAAPAPAASEPAASEPAAAATTAAPAPAASELRQFQVIEESPDKQTDPKPEHIEAIKRLIAEEIQAELKQRISDQNPSTHIKNQEKLVQKLGELTNPKEADKFRDGCKTYCFRQTKNKLTEISKSLTPGVKTLIEEGIRGGKSDPDPKMDKRVIDKALLRLDQEAKYVIPQRTFVERQIGGIGEISVMPSRSKEQAKYAQYFPESIMSEVIKPSPTPATGGLAQSQSR
jgi:hypothetical protein